MPISSQIVKGSLKYLILEILSKSEHYGYSLANEIRAGSHNLLKAGEGSLYPALYKLEKEGNIKSRWDEKHSPKRKYYNITRHGLDLLGKERADWKEMIKIINVFLKTDKERLKLR